MLTSVHGICKQQGFTLLELLVVVVVLSIATTLVVVHGMPSDKNHLEAEANKLAQLLRIAQQHAKLTSKDIRFVNTPEGYQFEELAGNRWVLVEKEPLLQPRTWEHGPFSVTLQQAEHTTPTLLLESQQGLIQQTLLLHKNKTTLAIERVNGGPFQVKVRE